MLAPTSLGRPTEVAAAGVTSIGAPVDFGQRPTTPPSIAATTPVPGLPLTPTTAANSSSPDVLVLDPVPDARTSSAISTDLPNVMPSDLAPLQAEDTTDGIGSTAPAAVGTYKGAERIIARTKAPKAKKKLKTLFIRTHWNGNRKDKTTPKRLRKLAKNADKVLRSATRGKYGITATVTPWVKIRSTSCDAVRLIGQRAANAAARRGRAYSTGRFDRVVVYFPQARNCAAWAGRGEMPGKYVWLNGAKQATVLAHELGHNFGLGHANVAVCSKSRTLTGSGKGCRSYEYGDLGDLMGAGPHTGLTQAAMQYQVSWLQRSKVRTVSKRKATVKLRARSANKGIRAIRVRGKAKTYWVEYRTRSGLDKVLSNDLTGVTIHVGPPSKGAASNALDLQPQNSNAAIALPVGASWISPEGIRFQVTKQAKKKATIKVNRRAGKAKKPRAPKKVTVSPGDAAALVTVSKSADRGAPIQRWRIRAVPVRGGNATSGTVTATAAKTRSALVQNLTNGLSYRVQVRARNEKGWSPWSKPALVTPAPVSPIITVASPRVGTSYSSSIPLNITARTANTTQAVITSLYAYLDVPWSPTPAYVGRQGFTRTLNLTYALDTGVLPDGTYPMRFVAHDSLGRVSAVAQNVVIAGKSPKITAATATFASNTLTVNYTMSASTNTAEGAVVAVRRSSDGAVVASSARLTPSPGVPSTWTVSGAAWAAGSYSVEVMALDVNFWPRDALPAPADPTWGYHKVARTITK